MEYGGIWCVQVEEEASRFSTLRTESSGGICCVSLVDLVPQTKDDRDRDGRMNARQLL